MKKLLIAALSAIALLFTACSAGSDDNTSKETTDYTQPDITITGSELEPETRFFTSYSLAEYAGKSITVNFSAEMKVTNNTDDNINLMWQLDIPDENWPMVAMQTFAPGTTDWTKVSTNKYFLQEHMAAEDTVLFLSTYQLEDKFDDIIIEIKNVKYSVTSEVLDGTDWLDESVPSLKDTFADKFDYFGLACEYNSTELANATTCKGLTKHANSTTMGNELKPDGFFGWGWNGSKSTMVDFTDSTGKTIKVPETLNYSRVDECLTACKAAGLKMRGHVLVWHSQTPDSFFAENYIADVTTETVNGQAKTAAINNLVDAATMTARQEWYIKSVMEHIKTWEAENNDGQHIIWAWDVVNEAMADDAGNSYTGSSQNWLRGSSKNTKGKSPEVGGGSFWYQIYGSEEFIVNAFRFANAYAPADVKLCYNDYNEYMNYDGGRKTDAILHLVDILQKAETKTVNGNSVAPRIDAIGMQSHVDVEQPFPSLSSYETALKQFLQKVDVHITELDIVANSENTAKTGYENYFKLLQKYGTGYNGSHKITNVTLWGLNNKNSWISNKSKYPLLFNHLRTTKAFWAVINSHQ